MELGTIEASEALIKDLYIDLKKKVNSWADLTKQTAQARMGYVGQHLVSVATGYPGGKSGARGYDLILPDGKYGEIKTCYRVDQLGKCLDCGESVASIEKVCPHCGSENLKRMDDSKWLIGIRNTIEFDSILDPEFYFLVLFDFEDVYNPDIIRSSIWRVDPMVPGFAYCMIDYNLNIRAKSKSKAPFNLWPYQLKFYLMKPLLIYRSYIYADDTIKTEIFPGFNDPILTKLDPLPTYSRSQNLKKEKIVEAANILSISVDESRSKGKLLNEVQEEVSKYGTDYDVIADCFASCLYFPEIEDHIENLPINLKSKINQIKEKCDVSFCGI